MTIERYDYTYKNTNYIHPKLSRTWSEAEQVSKSSQSMQSSMSFGVKRDRAPWLHAARGL